MSKGSNRLRVVPKLIAVMVRKWPVFLLGIFGLLLGAGVNMSLPEIGRRILDKDPLFNGYGLTEFAILFVGIFAVQGVFFYIRSFAFHRLAIQVAGELREQLFEALLRRPISFFDGVLTGDLLSRVTSDIALVQSLLGVHISVLLRYGAQILVGLVMMLIVSPKLSVYVLLLIPVLILPSVGLIARLRRFSKQQQQALGDAAAMAGEAFGGVRIVKSFRAEAKFSAIFRALQGQITAVSTSRANVSSFFSSFVGFLMNSCLVALLFMGFQEVVQNGLKPGGLLAFLLYGGIVAVSFAFFANAVSDFVQALGALERVMEFIGTGDVISSTTTKSSTTPKVEFKDVYFSYKPDLPPVLRGVSLKLDSEGATAIVGGSGSGKSTLVNILINWYRPTAGSILVNDEPLTESNAQALLASMAVVPQDTQLFSVSLRENVEVGGQAPITDVLAASGLTEVIKSLTDGIETKLGERGGRLSGGQRQRIALARALAAQPRLLVIDEGLSGLDPVTEGAVLKNIRKRYGLIFVTHRLSSIVDFDRILVMDEGRIVGDGRHEQLLQNCPQYKRLVDNSKSAEHAA